MAPLVGRHDPFHLHKTLGALCVAHFLWRAYCLLSRGEMFPASEPLWLALLGLSLHLALSGSAFLLPLPRTRVESLPVIWPEFRAHSAIFATRHVLATSMSLFDSALFPAGSGEAAPPRWAAAARAVCALVLLLAATGAAARATSALGAKGKSTTLTMAYPDCVDGDLRRGVKSYYAVCQFGATAACCCWDPAVSFAPLLGIQGAAFLMTLVRKGQISPLSYHKAYGALLWATFAVAATVRGQTALCLALTTTAIHNLRTRALAPRWLTCAVACLLSLSRDPRFWPGAVRPHLGWHGRAMATTAAVFKGPLLLLLLVRPSRGGEPGAFAPFRGPLLQVSTAVPYACLVASSWLVAGAAGGAGAGPVAAGAAPA
jgi:hypothetical protein